MAQTLLLIFLALSGGTPGALLGQAVFRHKTAKRSFRMWFWTLFLIQLVAIAGWLRWRGW